MLLEGKLMVGMADIHVSKNPSVFTCLGLGSCIGFCALDPRTGVAGMIHIMLPEAFKNRPVDKIGKFADTGMPELLRLLDEHGADRKRLVTAYSGGASVFQFGKGTPGATDIGARNAEAVKQIVARHGLSVKGIDTGGTCGRTMTFDSHTGVVMVKSVRSGEIELCRLK